MNILIVDDDKYVIEGVMNGIDWEQLPIENIYTALGSYQARDIFSKYQIHLMLCDIEIPNENGLALVEWVKKQGFHPQVIFFTSYAEFHYAKKAIQLDSFDYILKPIAYEELSKVILKATKAVEREENRDKYLKMGKYWFQNQGSLKESFWEKLLTRRLPLTKEAVYQQSNKVKLDYKVNDRFLLVSVDYGNPEYWSEKKELDIHANKISQALQNFINIDKDCIEALWREAVCRWFMVVRVTDYAIDKDDLWKYGKAFLEMNQSIIGIKGSIYFSETKELENTYAQMERIKEMYFRNMGFKEDVFFVDEFNTHVVEYQRPDIEELEILFSSENQIEVNAFIDKYLNYHAGFYELNEETLQCFMFDLMQLIFSMLRERQIDAHNLFADAKTRALYKKSTESITDMKNYLHYLVDTAIDYGKYIREPNNVIEKIEKYIDENLDQNITRSDLAKEVFLNADYMARMFKKEKGMSLVTYMTSKRMEKARQLILITKEPICIIATKVGYPSYSYFTKKFKEYYGMLPTELKKGNEIIL